jgi:hypothetical protein
LPLDAEDPLNPMNRRISLVVLNDKTERQIRGLPEEPMEEIQTEEDAAQVLGPGGTAEESPAEGESTPAPIAPAAPESTEPAGDRLAQPTAGGNPA